MNRNLKNGGRENHDRPKAAWNEFIGAAVLMLPGLLPGLSSGLQFFAPGVAACFLESSDSRRLKLLILSGVLVLGGILMVVLGRPEGMLLLAQSICIAAVLMVFTWAHRSAPEALVACSLCLAVLSITMLFLATGGKPLAAYHSLIQEMAREFDSGVAIYKKNAGGSIPPQMDEIMAQLKETMIAFFPGILGGVFIFLSLTNIYACSICGKTRGNRKIIAPEFSRWKMPSWLIWAFILSGLTALYPGEQVSALGKNTVAAVSVFYLIQGFAVMKFFFQTMKTPTFVRWMVYLLIGIQWYGLLMVIFTGLMDNWFNFRERLENNIREQKKTK